MEHSQSWSLFEKTMADSERSWGLVRGERGGWAILFPRFIRKTQISAFDVLTPPNPEYQLLIRTIDMALLFVIGDAGVVSVHAARELQGRNWHIQVESILDAGHLGLRIPASCLLTVG